jgi:hypothetical protein
LRLLRLEVALRRVVRWTVRLLAKVGGLDDGEAVALSGEAGMPLPE